MLVSKAEISNYLPQREPMLMVDELLEYQDGYTLSAFCPQADNVFINGNYFNESGMMENMAQTAALGIGYFAIKNKQEVPLGFIGAIKNLKIYRRPKIGQNIKTKITLLHEVLNASIVKAEVYLNQEKIAEGEYKIFLNPLAQNK
jgi:3-hydroxymyristoyl/3-hydroxydecanoyl-(acyl carrier protein) dehydratase